LCISDEFVNFFEFFYVGFFHFLNFVHFFTGLFSMFSLKILIYPTNSKFTKTYSSLSRVFSSSANFLRQAKIRLISAGPQTLMSRKHSRISSVVCSLCAAFSESNTRAEARLNS
jgi:hypothetical protein